MLVDVCGLPSKVRQNTEAVTVVKPKFLLFHRVTLKSVCLCAANTDEAILKTHFQKLSNLCRINACFKYGQNYHRERNSLALSMYL